MYKGTAAAQWLRCCTTSRKVAGSIPAGASGFFIDIKSFRSHYDPVVDSASNRNEYQEYFLGGKGDRCVRLTTLPPSCAVVMKSGNLNFLEPSGPLQACNGTSLPLHTVYTVCAMYLFNKKLALRRNIVHLTTLRFHSCFSLPPPLSPISFPSPSSSSLL